MKKMERYECIDNCPKGSVLILVLIIISSMTVLALGLTYRTYVEIKLARTYVERTQTYYLALGGIERLVILLHTQLADGPNDFSKISRICPFSQTAKEERLFEMLDIQTLKQCQLSYNLQDELSFLNINKSDPACWIKLEFIDDDLCASILDWLDSDDQTRPGGAETDFYQHRIPASIAKNSNFVSLKELLYIKRITHNLYLGEDINHNSVLDDNEQDGDLSPPFDNDDSSLDLGFLDAFTVYGDGRLNINTVSKRILAILPGFDTDTADSFLTYRVGFDGQHGTEDDVYFESPEDFLKVETLSDLQIELLEQYCCFDSEYFRAYSYARLKNEVDCLLITTIQVTDIEPKILYVDRLL